MRKKLELTSEETQKIIESYMTGMKISDIEKLIGHSDGVIYRVLEENNIPRTRNKLILSDDQKETILNLHDQKYSYKEIANIIGIKECSVYSFLRNNNVLNSYSETSCIDKIQEFKKSIKPIRFDEHIFDYINTPDKAYCIGLFMADGYNDENGNFSIELQARDVSILENIRILMQSSKPLYFTSANSFNSRVQDTYALRLYSKYFSQKLKELGIIRRKSLILDFPYWMDKELIPFMLRGYIDGDGWVQKYRVGFMSSDKFCVGVKEFLDSIGINCTVRDMKRHYDERTKTFDITGRNNIIPLVEMMFSSGNLYINRKYKKYIEFGFLNSINNSLTA